MEGNNRGGISSQPYTKGRVPAASFSSGFYRRVVFVRQESTAAQRWSITSHTRQVDTKMPLFYFDCFQKSKHFQTQLRYKIQHKMRIYTSFFFFFSHRKQKYIQNEFQNTLQSQLVADILLVRASQPWGEVTVFLGDAQVQQCM